MKDQMTEIAFVDCEQKRDPSATDEATPRAYCGTMAIVALMDEWGRAFVVLRGPIAHTQLAPAQARALSALLLLAVDESARIAGR